MIEGLERALRLRTHFERLGHPRCDLDHRAHGIARILRGERAIHDINARNILGRDHAPARGGRCVVVADQRRQQNPIGIDQAAGACPNAGCSRGDGVLRIADMAFAHQDVGQIFENVFGVDDVDALGRFGRRHALGLARNCCGRGLFGRHHDRFDFVPCVVGKRGIGGKCCDNRYGCAPMEAPKR